MRRLLASVSALMVLAGTAVLASPAYALASGSLANTSGGTVTATFSGGTTYMVLFCDSSIAPASCSSMNYTYRKNSTGEGLTSGAAIGVGSTVYVRQAASLGTLPDGTFSANLFDTAYPVTSIATLSNAVIGTGIAPSGGGSASSSSNSSSLETLSLAVTTDNTSCTGGNPTGYSGAWLTLPSADQCTQTGPTAKANATLLGWSTAANFPVARAQAQIDAHWGVIDEEIDGVRMIFIPAGMATFVSGSNTLYPVWSA